MNFVNKLSVISLLVLMFSFMNVAAADACKGTGVTTCASIKDQATCANYYYQIKGGSGIQCKWGNGCSSTGASCGPITNNCPDGKRYYNGSCNAFGPI